MADLSYDQFASNVRATYPQLDEAAIKSAYSTQYGQDPVRTSGPSLADFSANVRKTYPDLPDSHIQDAYNQAYGSDFGTSFKRAASAGFAHAGEFAGGLLGGLGQYVMGPKAADEAGQGVYDYWKSVEERNQPARALQGNPIDNPALLTTPGFYGKGLGALTGVLADPAFSGAQRATDLYGEGKLSAPKAIGLGAAETALNFTPLSMESRIGNAAAGAGLAAGTPALEAAATGAPVGEALKEGLGNAPFGALAGALVPGKQVDWTNWMNERRLGGAPTQDPAAGAFIERAQQLAGPAPEAPAIAPAPAPEPLPPIETAPLDPLSGPMAPETPSPIATKALVPYEQLKAAPEDIRGPLTSAFEHAVEAKPALDRALIGISQDIGTPHEPVFGPIKGVDRSVEKTVNENEGDVGKLKDLARGTVVADNFDQIQKAIQATSARFGKPTKLNNSLDPEAPTLANGFRSVNMNVMLRGRAVEIQVTVPEMAAAIAQIHGPYEKQRTILGEVKKAGGVFTPEQRAQVDALDSQMAQVTLPAWASFLNRMKSVSRSTVPSEYALAGGNGRPPGTSQALQIAPPSGVPSTDTGTPSTSQKYGIGTTDSSPPSPPIIAGRPAGAAHELMTKTGRKVPVEPRLVELQDLIHSQHPAFDQALQPRDRTRAASDAQVDHLARNPNLARTTIVIDHAGQVISGNGRTLAQHRMDSHYPANAKAYRAQLEAAGHNTAGMKRPVLVQQLPAMSHEDRMSFAREMNQGTQLKMSAAEQANEDAGKLKAPTLALLHPGAIESTANAPFVRAWMNQFPETERGSMLDAEGHLSADGIRRIHNAVLARAYGGSEHSKAVLARAIESSDNEVRSITGAMLDAAPAFAELKQSIEAGRVPKEFDTTAQLTEAVEATAQMRSEGRSLTETLGQGDAFNPRAPETEAWMRAFHTGARAASKQAITERLDTYARDAVKQDVNQGQLLETKAPTPLELINNAIGSEAPAPSTPDMFADRVPTRAYLGDSVSSRNGQLSLPFGDFETRADTVPAQVEAGKAALSALVSRRDSRAGANVLADRITRDFTHQGFTPLIGQQVRTAADLAALAQVYRDPRFETLRVVYMRGGEVVGHEGHSSRMPSAVKFGDAGVTQAVKDGMKKYGADGYWLSHNHPAGSAKPSANDIYNTVETAREVPGYRGHVIIDHDQYGTISETGEPKVHPNKFGGFDPNANPRVPHRYLDGRPSSTPGAMVQIFRALQIPKGFITLITINPQGRVGGIAEFPTALLSEKQGPRALVRLRRMQRESGADAYVYAVSAREDFLAIRWLHQKNLITDSLVRWPDAKGDLAVAKMAGGGVYESRPSRGLFGMADQPHALAEEIDPRSEFVPGAENDIGGGTYKLRQFANLEPAELQVLSDVVENLDGPVADQRRGSRSWDATEEAALKLIQKKYGVTLDQLVNRKKGSTANAEQLEAYAQIISATSKSIRALADEVVATGSHESKIALAAAKDKLALLLAPALGYQTEAGRALNILKKTAAANAEAGRLLDALGDGSDATLTEFAKKVKQAGNIDQVIGLTRAAYTPSLWDKIYEGWISGLLSGPTTHAVNITSNALFNVLDLAADMGGVLAKDSTVRGLVAKIAGQGHGVMIGLHNAAVAFKTEEPQIGSHMQTQHPRRAIGGTLGRVVRTPLRALLAADEYFKAIAYHGELGRIAMERAIAGKKQVGGQQSMDFYPIDPALSIQERFNKILGAIQNDPDLALQAMQAAERATFQTDLGAGAKAGQRFLELTKVGKIIIPFVRTPTNIIKQAIEFSPGAPVFEKVRDAISNGGRDGALAWSRMMIGSGIMLGMVALAMKGLVSGNGPNNPEERALLMRQGWQPYSVKVGGQWYKYNRIDPIGTLLGVAADMHDIIGYAKPEEIDKMASAVITSLALNLGDKTFLRGITDFSQAYADPQRYLQRWAQGLAGSIVPNLAAQVARGMDPFMRQTDTMLEAIKAKIPGLRETLTKKLDIAGQPINQVGDLPGNAFPAQAQQQDKLADAMLRLGVNKAKPSQSIDWLTRSVKLTPEEYQDYASATQQARWKVLTPLVSSPQFQAAIQQSPDLAAKLLGDQWDNIGSAMKTRWLYSHPEVIRRLAQPKAPRSGSPYAQEAATP